MAAVYKGNYTSTFSSITIFLSFFRFSSTAIKLEVDGQCALNLENILGENFSDQLKKCNSL